MKASDLFVQCLENEGVEYIFGLPREENADLMMSLKNSSIRFVLCRHEQVAADIVLSDVGAHKMWIARYYQCDEPNTCLISNGFCSMGFAMPGAMASKLVYPDRRVLAICGDAGGLMNIQDLETARRVGLPFVMMVWEDGEYGLIKWKQQSHFGEHSDLAFSNPDWVKLAEAFDCRGIRCSRAEDLGGALEEAFASDVPTILALPIDYRENMKLTQRLGEIQVTI